MSWHSKARNAVIQVGRALGRRPLLALAAGWSHAKTQQKSNKEWAKLSDKDWDRIVDEWDSDEEKEEYEYKPPQRKGIDMEKLQKAKGKEMEVRAPPHSHILFLYFLRCCSYFFLRSLSRSQKLIADSQVTSGPTMMFATIDYPDCDKKKTEEIGALGPRSCARRAWTSRRT